MKTLCVEWTGATNSRGYGVRRRPRPRRMVYVHRDAWEEANGPIPDGMVIDHLCNNRACYNVDHLRLATHSENQHAEHSPTTNANKTHCKQGHEFSQENTYMWRGARYCRTCRRERNENRR